MQIMAHESVQVRYKPECDKKSCQTIFGQCWSTISVLGTDWNF